MKMNLANLALLRILAKFYYETKDRGITSDEVHNLLQLYLGWMHKDSVDATRNRLRRLYNAELIHRRKVRLKGDRPNYIWYPTVTGLQLADRLSYGEANPRIRR
jgi:hypothetical protein